jgi:hypothetical protein
MYNQGNVWEAHTYTQGKFKVVLLEVLAGPTKALI